MNANSYQVGGNHYLSNYQCWDFTADIHLNIYLHSALKYILRHKNKGKEQDLKKARHYIQKEIERELCKTSSISKQEVEKFTSKFIQENELDEFQYELLEVLVQYRIDLNSVEHAASWLLEALDIIDGYTEAEYPKEKVEQYDMFELSEN